MKRPIINDTAAVRLAREAIAWWDEQVDAEMRMRLFIKEPAFVQRARKILNGQGGRIKATVKPQEKV